MVIVQLNKNSTTYNIFPFITIGYFFFQFYPLVIITALLRFFEINNMFQLKYQIKTIQISFLFWSLKKMSIHVTHMFFIFIFCILIKIIN